MKATLIIDADDTLWENEAYYEQCIAEFGALMATLGLDREEAQRTVDDVERERVPLTGYGPRQFTENMLIAYERLCERHGRAVADETADGVREIGRLVMVPPVALLDGVENTLTRLNGHYHLLLLTKGDTQVQQDKLARSGLGRFFDGVHVVPEKDAQVFHELVTGYGLEPERTWMVGNSPRSDINPALEAGIGAIHIPHSSTWVLERAEIAASERVVVLESFGELLELFPALEAVGKSTQEAVSKTALQVGGSIMSEYTIRPYDSGDNAGLAVMWNESDDQWPGGFTDGVPMTEERVRDWMNEEVCLMRFVVEHETGQEVERNIVGFGSLWESARHEDNCYVAVLNVHPGHQKRSLARRMLTRMVDYATEHGYRRMTIGTWPSNIKSVPLYKKVGFFWTPDTNVDMENYIPAIRQLSIARRFFERHDWYTSFRRELDQVEDEQRHPATGDMKVYVSRWEEDGDFLEAVADRQGESLTGLETAELAAYAIVDQSVPAQGIAYPLRWRVVNKRDVPVNVSVLAEGETGIELEHRSSFALAAGEERVVQAAFTCATDAPRPDAKKPAPKIKTTLVVGGDVLELGTGLRYRPAVEVSAEPEFPSLLPGQAQTVHLQLHNRAGRPLRGVVSVSPQEGLTTDWTCREFEIEEKGYTGLPLAVTCDRAGATPLIVAVTFADGERQITTQPQRIPLLVTPFGGVSADRNGDKIVVENDFFQLTCRAKGGLCRVWNKARQEQDIGLWEEVGPPFVPWELGEKQHDLALERGQGWAKATVAVKSDRFPGLTVLREMTVTGSPLVQVRYRIVNDAAARIKSQLQPIARLRWKNVSLIAMPRKERLVIERASEFPIAHGDFPKKSDGMAEQWTALTREGQAVGVVWNEDVVEHELWWDRLNITFAERTLEPQSAVEIGPLYVYAGPGDWRDVRRVWQRTTGVTAQAMPEPDRPHSFGLSPAPLVTLNGQVEARLRADNVREFEMQGRVVVEPPPGWTVERAEFPVEGLAHEKPLQETLRLTATGGRVGAADGQLRLETKKFDEARPFTLIRLGDESATVQVAERQQAGQSLWDVANGRCTWTVAPDYHGGVTAWREAGSDVDHLMTAFPENGELGWLKPWFGGVWPVIMPKENNDEDWPGKLHEETFTTTPFEAAGADGIAWRGVQAATLIERDECKGIRVEIAYLTVGGSNVLKVVYRLVNETGVYRRFTQGLMNFCQVDGEHQNTVLYGDGYQRKRMSQMGWTVVGSWGAAVNPSSGRALAVVGASGQKRIELSDWGVDGGHVIFYNYVTLAPHGSHEMVAYLVLAESLEEAKRYGSFAGGRV